MQFQLRHLIGFVAALAAMMAYWRHGVDSRESGREEVRRQLESRGVLKATGVGFTVFLDDRQNLHVIQKVPGREGVAVVELWDCRDGHLPTLVRTVDIPLDVPIILTEQQKAELDHG